MATVHIRVNGQDYEIACDDGQEEQLRFLADEIDDRIRALVFQMGTNPGEGMALLLAALTVSDELTETKKEIDNLSSEVRRLTRLMGEDRPLDQCHLQQDRMQEIEAAMAETLEEIALRIEKIAEQVEVG